MGWRIVVATNNWHKLQEFQQIAAEVAPGELEFVAPEAVLGVPWQGSEESGGTLEENAYLKATALFERIYQPVVADDTGFEVEALGGRPGVRSARFVGTEAENRRAVLELLRDVPPERRTARFRCVLCYRDQLRTVCVEGIVEGTVALEERGEGGFGYDPIFLPRGYERTFGEMEPWEKNRISHRHQAILALLQFLRRLEQEEGAEVPVVEQVQLPPWLPWLVRISAVAGQAEQGELLQELISQALRAGMPIRALAEGLLQVCLFAGFPAAIEALQLARTVCQRLGLVWETLEAETDDALARGQELFARVYGEQSERVRERLRQASPILEELVLRVAYGEVLARSELSPLERECAAVAVLASGGWWRQLRSHLRGMLRFGISPEQATEILEYLRPYCSPSSWERLQEEWQQAQRW